jgi:hypothetical protein
MCPTSQRSHEAFGALEELSKEMGCERLERLSPSVAAPECSAFVPQPEQPGPAVGELESSAGGLTEVQELGRNVLNREVGIKYTGGFVDNRDAE